jgi:hypothetical protein
MCAEDEHPLAFLEQWQPGRLADKCELDDFIESAKASMIERLHVCQNQHVCAKEISRFPIVDIIQMSYLPSGYCVGVKKTHWLSVFQRKWRNYLREKKANEPSIPSKRKFCSL